MDAYDADEAAARLRVKPGWLRRQAERRLIPFTMLGGTYHFTDDHLAEICAQFERRPAEAPAASSRAPCRQAGPRPALQSLPLRPRPAARRGGKAA